MLEALPDYTLPEVLGFLWIWLSIPHSPWVWRQFYAATCVCVDINVSVSTSQRFLRFMIAMPSADARNRLQSQRQRQNNAALRPTGISSAISDSGLSFRSPNPLSLRESWEFGSVNAKISSDCDSAILVCLMD